MLRGGAGEDVAVYRGDASGYTITFRDGRTVVEDVDAGDGDFGVDVLRGVEPIQFGDALLVA